MAVVCCGNGFCCRVLLFVASFSILNAQSYTDTYLGCYEDIGQYGSFPNPYSSQNMTPDHCREHCRNKSLTFAGLSEGDSCGCFIHNWLDTSILTRLNESRCIMSCDGDHSKFCGGARDSNIYSIHSTCSKGTWGNKYCKQKCNCKDDRSCSVLGVCPNNKCAPGWTVISKSNRDTCTQDVDECKAECNSTNTIDCHNCNATNGEVCNNTEGSFHCICRSGFISKNGKCIDIDECSDNQSRCNQTCRNTIGSYDCSCFTGYELKDKFSCYDVNECERNHSCAQVCENTVGSYKCSCRSGYELDSYKQRCNDIDECSRNQSRCNQECRNTIGSYNCSCKTGYELRDMYNCMDINECERNNGGCTHLCNNTVGSYKCSCHSGFVLNFDKHRCNDIDECDRKQHKCNQQCVNTVGGYNCSCSDGYELRDNYTCVDINECERNPSVCAQECENNDGGYRCSCRTGYKLGFDKRWCYDIDECALNQSKCNQKCSNTIGSYKCSCFDGYKLQDNFTCVDIDDCALNQSKCNQKCINTIGSYKCSCFDGFELQNNFTCVDIDECIRKEAKCNQNCTNTIGSYTCSCFVGYRLQDKFSCVDFNECASDNGGCQHYCNNTVGSFTCSCRPGFKKINEAGDQYNCSDINECEVDLPCDHICNNLEGNYSCSCDSGFYLAEDFKMCHKDWTITILAIVLVLIIVSMIVMVVAVLKLRGLFPFNKSVSSKEGHPRDKTYENGTKEMAEFKKTKPTNVNNHTKAAVTSPAKPQPASHVTSEKKTCVAVKDLKTYIESINSADGFEDEFKSIPMVAEFSYEIAQAQALKPKNRFKNILPYDYNRVVLDEVNDDPLTTYINASFIRGYKKQDKIIASHGPTPNTVDDFWRMVWQYDVNVIVMVTKCLEDGKRKCEQYWPLEGSLESGDLTISLVSVEKWPDYIVTRLKVSKDTESRLVVHLLFTDWPDHGVPDHATSLISFRRAVRNVVVPDRYFIVHCSAGVGRTGTFLGIDYLLQEANDKKSVDVYKYLQGLRDQRMNAVQTLDQYEFMHLALLEALTLGETVIPCSSLSSHRKHLSEINSLTGKSHLQTQFDLLQEMHPPLMEEAASVALSSANVSRNRDPKIVPGDSRRVFLTTESTDMSDYINAVFVSSYRKKDAFISTELPLPETSTEFWLMTLSYKCKLLVFLDTSGDQEDLKNCLLIPQKTKLSVNRHKFWMSSAEPTKVSDNCSSYLIAVATPPDDDEDIYANAEEIASFKILLLHFQLKSQKSRLAEQLPEVSEQVRTSSTSVKDNGPIVIISRDGVSPSGQFIAVSNLLEMSNSQHEVDVFNAVHNVKRTQPYFITSIEDYEMIFKALEAEGDTSTYANI